MYKFLFLSFILLSSNISTVAQDLRGHIFTSVVGNNSSPVIFNDVNLNTYELLTTNIQISKEDNLQKIVLAPFKILDKSASGILNGTRVNIAQKNGVTTFGLGIGTDNASPFSKRGNKKFSTMGGIPALRPKNPGESDFEYALFTEQYNKTLIGALYTSYYENLLKNSFKWNFGYNVSLFEIIGGDLVDIDKDTVIDNFHKREAHTLSLSGTYVFSSASAISLSTYRKWQYSSSKQNEKQVPYLGYSASFAHRAFILDKNYKLSENYLKSLFIPSVVLGVTIEYLKAIGNKNFAKDGVIETLVFTPFIEFKISPANQVRLGIPIKKYSGINKEVEFGPFLQYSLQIAKIE